MGVGVETAAGSGPTMSTPGSVNFILVGESEVRFAFHHRRDPTRFHLWQDLIGDSQPVERVINAHPGGRPGRPVRIGNGLCRKQRVLQGLGR